MSDRRSHELAAQIVAEAATQAGLEAHDVPRDVPGDLSLVSSSGRTVLVRVLVATAPHPRGGRGNLGLHWMLRHTPAEFVALVDLSRQQGWLMPNVDFQARAKPLAGPRFHLDWIVAPVTTQRSIPDESDFDGYTFARALPRLAHRLCLR